MLMELMLAVLAKDPLKLMLAMLACLVDGRVGPPLDGIDVG